MQAGRHPHLQSLAAVALGDAVDDALVLPVLLSVRLQATLHHVRRRRGHPRDRTCGSRVPARRLPLGGVGGYKTTKPWLSMSRLSQDRFLVNINGRFEGEGLMSDSPSDPAINTNI